MPKKTKFELPEDFSKAGLLSLLLGGEDSAAPDRLLIALENCRKAVKQCDQEADRLRSQQKSKGYSKSYVEFQLDLIRKQSERAVKEAERRLKLLDKLKKPDQQEKEMKLCRQDTVTWFRNWAWTIDPRALGAASVVPFYPFDFQIELIEWLEDLIFLKKTDGLIEKSRDMGVSWLMTAFVTKHWRFAFRFDALLGSRKEDLVDAVGRMDSLFEKIRFQIEMLPDWMLPEGFERHKHINYMKIVNPATGSSIAGESSNPDFGRAGRYSLIVLDEFASYPNGGYEAWTACSQSARTKIPLSTPKGKINKFADLRFKSQIEVKSVHWRKHEWKDERWYKEQKRTMNAEEIAQELDLDYEASQPGMIFPMWSELHHVITWGEFAAYYGESAYDEEGKPRIPKHWQLGRSLDWGSTVEHRCASLWAARPGVSDPLSDSVFIYREYIAPVGDTPRQVAFAIRKQEAAWRETLRMTISVMSHEAKSERDTFVKEHALSFEPWETDYTAGIAQIQNYLEIRKNQKHPFRPGMTEGRPRLFLLVDDNEGAVMFDEISKRYRVTDGSTSKGCNRLRMEIPRYHYPRSEEGRAVQARRPFKLYDDAIDCLRALAVQWFPQATEIDEREALEKRLNPEVRLEALSKTATMDMAQAWLSRRMALDELEDKGAKDGHWRTKFWNSQGRS